MSLGSFQIFWRLFSKKALLMIIHLMLCSKCFDQECGVESFVAYVVAERKIFFLRIGNKLVPQTHLTHYPIHPYPCTAISTKWFISRLVLSLNAMRS